MSSSACFTQISFLIESAPMESDREQRLPVPWQPSDAPATLLPLWTWVWRISPLERGTHRSVLRHVSRWKCWSRVRWWWWWLQQGEEEEEEEGVELEWECVGGKKLMVPQHTCTHVIWVWRCAAVRGQCAPCSLHFAQGDKGWEGKRRGWRRKWALPRMLGSLKNAIL